jgi:thiol-disulfide isomerase/thioredoxin
MKQTKTLNLSVLLPCIIYLLFASTVFLLNVKGISKDSNNISSQSTELIKEIDQTTNTLPQKPDPEGNREQWDSWRAQDFEVRKHRIMVIEKLEKENLPEDKLKPYIVMKIDDIESCFYYARLGEANRYEAKLYHMMNEGSPLTKTLATELFWSLNIYHVNTHLMHLSEVDMQQIADFELSRKQQLEAGRLLARAIRSGMISWDSKAKWSTWILENINPKGEGYEWVVAKNRRVPSEGKVFEFGGKDLNGKHIDSKQLKGKVVLLDFWAFWCGHCLAQMPDLKELNEKYYSKGLRIVGVFNDYRIDQLKEYVRKYEIDWPQLVEETANKSSFVHPLAKRYGFTGLPWYMLIDRDGRLAETSVRLEYLKPKILELLGHK